MSAHFLCWPCRVYRHGLHLMICGAALSPPPPTENPFSCKMTAASLCQDCALRNELEICQEEKEMDQMESLETQKKIVKTTVM